MAGWGGQHGRVQLPIVLQESPKAKVNGTMLELSL